ncbi:hypothetical protein O6H91_06G104600 [Diphasiastrum complanatum]|uniref:Uncharacterized protein n=1 Tax=Diphasiastrum complanatum TaxID=34168 RepID=A0ACC2DHN6_DIPCM|nr:hypothetical protein O6H91_06G104600 [Diphasiastrum complanatum]
MSFRRSVHSLVDQSSDVPLLLSDDASHEDWRHGQFDKPSYFARGEFSQVFFEKTRLGCPTYAPVEQGLCQSHNSKCNGLKDFPFHPIAKNPCDQIERNGSCVRNATHLPVAKASPKLLNTSSLLTAPNSSYVVTNNRTDKELIAPSDGSSNCLEWASHETSERPASNGRVGSFVPPMEKSYAAAGVWKGPLNSEHIWNCFQEQNSSKPGVRSLARHSTWESNHMWNGVPVPLPSLRRESSGGSFTDSLASSDCQAQLPSPSRSCNPNDITFSNVLDEIYKQDGSRGRRGQYDDSVSSLAQQTEQSYNLQLALALRLMADAELTEEPGFLDSPFEEDGQCYSSAKRSVLATAHRFWVNGSLGYLDKVQDGFYHIWGINPYVWTMCNDIDEGGHMPSLESLLEVDPSDLRMSVILIDSKGDLALQDLVTNALRLKGEASDTRQLAEQLGKLVCMHMGGAAASEQGSLISCWNSCNKALKEQFGSVVLPIGSLTVGLCRHRALLFKTLCDKLDLPCRVARCCKFCGSDEGASCIVICETEREYYIDLIVNPGTLFEHDCFFNNSSLPIASPLRLPEFKSSGVTDEDRSWGRNFAFGSGDQEPFPSDKVPHTAKEGSCQPYEMQTRNLFSKHAGQAFDQCFPLWSNMKRMDHEDQVSVIFRDTPVKSNHFIHQGKALPDVRGGLNNICTLDFPGEKVNIEKHHRSSRSTFGAIMHTSSTFDPPTKPLLGSSTRPSTIDQAMFHDSWEIPWEEIDLKEKIGAGSFGTVHRGDCRGSDVAVKILTEQDLFEEQLSEFMREVEIMKRMRHPNVVLFMGAVTKRPNFAIVTEFLPRDSLFRLLHKPGARKFLDERRRIRMALDVAKGMNYLHRMNPPIVHRDLKSPNLLVDKNWTVKVADFGLSRLKANTYLSSRSGAGTPEWMAPEVLRDEPSNEKSDVYSFGVILWELVTLQQPWNGMSAAQVVGAVGFQKRRLQIPKDVNPELVTIIESCWDSEPSKRPSFAGIMHSLKQLQKSSMPPG